MSNRISWAANIGSRNFSVCIHTHTYEAMRTELAGWRIWVVETSICMCVCGCGLKGKRHAAK